MPPTVWRGLGTVVDLHDIRTFRANTMSTPHIRRAAFLRFVIGTGIAAAASERKWSTTLRKRALTVEQEDRLQRATRTANDANRYLRQLARAGADARVADLANSAWPDAATTAGIQLQLLRALRHGDFDIEEYDFSSLDLSTIDLTSVDVRTFDDQTFRG